MFVLQMPQVIAEDEEGACHSEAETGVIFSVTEASRPARTCCELEDVRKSSIWNAVPKEIRNQLYLPWEFL